MRANRWLDRTQPQTLYMATIILYINAALGLIDGLLFSPLGAILTLGAVGAGFGIANEKKVGYWAAVVLTLLTVVLILATFSSLSVINLIFEVALAALLLHPQSREYRKIWFK